MSNRDFCTRLSIRTWQYFPGARTDARSQSRYWKRAQNSIRMRKRGAERTAGLQNHQGEFEGGLEARCVQRAPHSHLGAENGVFTNCIWLNVVHISQLLLRGRVASGWPNVHKGYRLFMSRETSDLRGAISIKVRIHCPPKCYSVKNLQILAVCIRGIPEQCEMDIACAIHG
jgi:hypothetical protein